MNERPPIPVLTDVRQVSDGWIKKYILTYAMPDGSYYEYESVSRKDLATYRSELERNAAGLPSHPDAVCVIPQLPDGNLLLIREFRYPVNAWCVAFPAGLIEPGEDVADCIDRELLEETGYRLRRDMKENAISPLPQSGYSSTGFAEENVQVVFARVERAGDAQPEQSEFIETFTLARADVVTFLATNTTPIGTRCQLILEMFARTSETHHP